MTSKAEIDRQAFRRRIWVRDFGRCGFCGGAVPLEEMDLDHIVMRAEGGSDDEANLRPAHRSCNRKAGGSSVWRFRHRKALGPERVVALRLPRDLHAQLKAIAREENRTLHGQILWIVQEHFRRSPPPHP